MSKLLINEYPMIVLPKLATEVGLNEAIFLQQLHYWLNGEHAKVRDGRKWVYNTYEEWQVQFPFWSISTIRRTINSLEKSGYLVAGNFNRMKIDNTKWYTINYSKLESLNEPSVQNEQTSCSNWTDAPVQNEQANNQRLPETISEITKKRNNVCKQTAVPVSNPRELEKVIDQEPATIIQRYAEEYKEVLNRKHPNLKREQVERIAEVISDITVAHGLSPGDWEDLITSYFAEGSIGDGNMNRFFSGNGLEGVIAGMLG